MIENRIKIYTSLCALFALAVVCCNLFYRKFICIDILPFHRFELSAGVLLYPAAFFITDLITEFYGKQYATFCVRLGIACNIVIALVVTGLVQLHATAWSEIDDNIFSLMFGFVGISFVGSIIACYIAQIIDISIYTAIKKVTGGRFLWLRTSLSTAISLLIDTSIITVILAYFGAIPWEQAPSLVLNSYIFKIFFIICSIPVFYAVVAILHRISPSTTA
jgi:queuosine precursor transporter